MTPLEPPSVASRSSYARRFQDPRFWQPYVDEVLRRHNLPSGLSTLGTGGTFPTFLVGAYAIKFFGQRFDGAECFEIERLMHTRVLPSLRVTVPRRVADGHMFQTGWRWQYIVTTWFEGTAWREMSDVPGDWQRVVASELGVVLRGPRARLSGWDGLASRRRPRPPQQLRRPSPTPTNAPRVPC